jgi:AraC-like DNA-binding protein
MTPEHSALPGKTLLEELKSRGFSADQIVGNTGVRLSVLEREKSKLRFDQLAVLFERAADLTGDDLIGFKIGQNLEFRRMGLIYYACSSSPTLRTLLQVLSRYERVFGDAVERNNERIEEGILTWRFRAPRAVKHQQYAEFQVAATIEALRRQTGRNLYPLRVDLRHHRAGGDAPMRKFFGCPLNFGADENRLVLKPTDLDQPLLASDDHLYRLMLQYCDQAIEKMSKAKSSLVYSVEEAISKDPTTTQAGVARQLGMSVRTLSRRLTANGTSYSEVLDGYRETMSKSMIDDSEMSLTEIAFVLGYSDLSSFSTAFRRWVGKTPTEYRGRVS